MEFHEIANIFPLLIGDDYKELREHIRTNGLLEPITVYEGKILDGRNRYIACLDIGIEPQYVEFGNHDPIAYVVGKNLIRRHLTTGQRAFASLEVKRMYAEKAKQNQGRRTDLETEQDNFFLNLRKSVEEAQESINATQKAAEIFGVSETYVTAAEQIDKNAPDIAERVKSGEWNMHRAKTEYKRRKKKKEVEEYTLSVKDTPALEKSYSVIYADPPWQYSDNAADKHNGMAENHYTTLSIENVKEYLEEFHVTTTKDAVLFLWVTNPFVKKALDVVESWGFEYKTNIVWVKTELKKPGVGYYVRGRHELLFICTKGSFTPLDKNISPPIGSVLEYPVSEHSKKPDVIYEIIEKLYPQCTYIELFARNKREGWDYTGNEVK